MILIDQKTNEEVKEEVISTNKDIKDLILFNDDVHSFDFVIKSLIRICGHSAEQAEQSAYIVHNNGKCTVKHGEVSKIKPMCKALTDQGLTAEVN
jgi:ATP-dependent Clp protease adaptor protein ClpS